MEESLIKRIKPHNMEAEQSVIGAMLMDEEAIMAASEIITQDDFYHQQYGVMFGAMVEMLNEGMKVDVVTLRNRLLEKDVPPEACSIDVLRDIYMTLPTSINVRDYAKIVYEKSMLRRLIKVNEEIEDECYLGRERLDNILEKTETDIFRLLQSKSNKDFVPIDQITSNVIDNIDAAARSNSPVTGLSTGFKDLDVKTSGLQPSDLVLIAARPSMGKTAFVLNLAQNIAIKNKYTTAIFSLEMSNEQLVNRLLSMQAGVDAQKMRNGNLSENDWENIVESSGTIAQSALVIDDTPGISMGELRSKCRKLKLEKDLKLIIIDYLQLMSGSGRGSDSRQQEISDISRSLKALARELHCPVVALSQLSRACESRQDHRPMLSDLRESGAIEQDADVVMFLYRDDYYNKASEAKNIAEVILAKQRNGPIGTVELHWNPDRTKFGNLEPKHE